MAPRFATAPQPVFTRPVDRLSRRGRGRAPRAPAASRRRAPRQAWVGAAAVASQGPEPVLPAGPWRALVDEPAAVELIVVAAVALLAWVIARRAIRSIRAAAARAGVRDYLLGVQQVLGGDWRGGAVRLARVLDDHPDNVVARLLYARARLELGDAAEAHCELQQVRRSGDGCGVQAERWFAEALLAVGEPAEAAEVAGQAVRRNPADEALLELRFRAESAAGAHGDAAVAGLAWARRAADPAAAARRVGAAVGGAVAASWARRDADAVYAVLSAAASEPRLATAVAPLLAVARAVGAEQGAEPGDHRPVAVPAPAELPPLRQALAILAAAACPRCGAMAFAAGECWRCAAGSSGGLGTELESPTQVMDAIDENDAHLARLVEAAARSDAAAVSELVDLGAPAVGPLLRRALDRREDTESMIDVLQLLGPAAVPALFSAHGECRRGAERNAVTAVVGRVVQGLGAAALPAFEAVLDTGDRDLRKVVIDFYLGLGMPDLLDALFERFPPLEVVHRLNAAAAGVVRGLLRRTRRGTFFAEVVLLEPGFTRDVELLDATVGAGDPELLIEVLVRRGFGKGLARAALDRLGDPDVAPAAVRLLDAFGKQAIPQHVAVLVDGDAGDAVRAAVIGRLGRLGADVVPALCECFGRAPAPSDDAVLGALAAVGAEAVWPVVDAYRRSSLLESFGGPLANRHTHRRLALVRALRGIGGGRARQALRELAERETDRNLRLRLLQALHDSQRAGAAADAEEGRGQAG